MDGDITARVVEFAGRCGDAVFESLLVEIEGAKSPFMLTMSFPKSSCDGLAGKVDTSLLYRRLADAVNAAHVSL